MTPKQLMFFKPAVDILKAQNNEILCTTRKYREVDELSKIIKLDLVVVGSHGGSDLYNKLYQSTTRIIKLTKIVHKFSPDLLISFCSPEASRVSFGLGIKHFGFNDSPHAEAVAKLTVPLLSKLFCPSIIPVSAWEKYGISSDKIIKYDGLDPIAWIKRRKVNNDNQKDSYKFLYPENKDTVFLSKLNVDLSKKSILIRLEESQASYISNKNLKVQPIDLVDKVVKLFGTRCNVIILCRYAEQIDKITKRFRNKAIVLRRAVDGIKLLNNVDIFIGAGGTMTAEAALLGKPTISIAPIQFLIDDYLKKIGLVNKIFNHVQLEKYINMLLEDEHQISIIQEHANKILNKMEDPIETLLSHINR